MHQVLLNLLKNAIEASLEGGEIRLKLFQDENQSVVLEITNGGEVLGAETLERAFEPFYTTKPRGSGLGLGLVKRIVEEHGGSITLSSDPSLGTCVTVTLPIDAE
jgi:signal transduction histidine kinase